MAIKKNHSSS